MQWEEVMLLQFNLINGILNLILELDVIQETDVS